ncbi:MAG: hypothetical protein JNM14_04235 [Ferruginibacter sp.]|nr:hypothetical protein [Ferruginibacter sp.]
MKKIMWLFLVGMFFICCNNQSSEKVITDKRVVLRSDTLNIIKLTDTLVIHESACRGCAYEASTYFGLSDSMDIIQLLEVITKDNNSPDMQGGSISKTIVMFPAKTGKTNFKLYKFLTSNGTPQDSALFTRYNVEVIN